MASEKQMLAGEVPVSPFSRLFSMPGFYCFNIVTIGFKNEASPSAFIEGLKNTLINHPRFSRILEIDEDKAKWIPTKVKVEDHVVVPDIDPTTENPDQFLEDYTSNMVFSPIDMSKPLWEIHILNMKTSDAESLLVFHSYDPNRKMALIVHLTSYVNKVIINLGVDLDVIPDPHHLCDDIVEALQMMKSVVEENSSAELGV
ncbi:unnamed protein product [Eruca vesicaria subsp. sativa]|uniref:O-acyltransferase WSD1 C-terminal domain-containing protein n=1 Tax=Eruca vesicaria subsp. sativa TaxID=29727 RepID=A0ABC8JTN2_ERUVS|nr:unnamed protein product [Eruca vesicaria subsp. sativa]